MFTEIILLNYDRPLRKRADMRKVVGPYRWTPSRAYGDRGFYMKSNSLTDRERANAEFAGVRLKPRESFECDDYGAGFRLRSVACREFMTSYQRSRITESYSVGDMDDSVTPFVMRLPRNRGFLAGWTLGHGMYATVSREIYRKGEDAAYYAHQLAECQAEEMWYDEYMQAQELQNEEDAA